MDKIETALKFSQYASIFGNTRLLIIAFIFISIITLFLFYILTNDFGKAFSIVLYLIFLPSIAFVSFWKIIFRKYLLSHAIMLVIAYSFIVFVIFVISVIMNYRFNETATFIMPVVFIASLAIAFVLTNSKKDSFITAIILTSFVGFSFFNYLSLSYRQVLKEMFLSSLFVFFMAFISLKLIDAPFKKKYGVSAITIVSSFLSGWFYGNESLEKMLERIGQKVKIKVVSLRFDLKEGKKKNVFYAILPYFHFGPFANIGSSKFPSIAKHYFNNVIVFHGTSTHELNLVDYDQNRNVLKAVENANYREVKNVYIDKTFYGDATADLLSFDGNAIVFLSRAPKITEDIAYEAGLLLMEKLKKEFNDAYIVDRHDSPASKITTFSVFSEEFYDYINAVEQLKNKKGVKPKIGFCSSHLTAPEVDEGGLSVLYIKANKEIVIISIDSNGISLQASNYINGVCQKLGIEPIICTTDSHGKNVIENIVNDYKINNKDKEIIRQCILNAKESAFKSEARVYLSSQDLKLNIIGKTNIEDFIATINATWAILKYILPLSFILTLIGLFFILGAVSF